MPRFQRCIKVIDSLKTKWSILKNDFIEHDLSIYDQLIGSINSLDYSNVSDDGLKEMAGELAVELAAEPAGELAVELAAEPTADQAAQAERGKPLDEKLVKVFALVREAAVRTVGMRPFDVQMMAGTALHMRKLVEMQTGEGKTLAAVAPACLHAFTGKGVHILTFNDYLARRDAEWMGPVYNFVGLTVGHIGEGMTPEQRKAAYLCDVTYVTAKEAGFDYLRDSLCTDQRDIVHRKTGFNYAIVDEADSILIDEARIPMVIAGNTQDDTQRSALHLQAELADMARRMKRGMHYNIDVYSRNVFLTDEGAAYAEKGLCCGNLYNDANYEILTRLNCALHAETLLKRDIDYIVRNGAIELVDEFTGRIADKRHWPDGLQAALEAKEKITATSKGCIWGTITVRNFIALYPQIAGMTGTAAFSAEEFHKVYDMNTVVIPTNKPNIRLDQPDVVFTHKKAKTSAIVEEVCRAHSIGRPVLIGTVSIEESERLASCLMEHGIACKVLNARNDRMEAAIIAEAGMPGAVTVSTNMAGRGTDIKLGGNDERYRDDVVSTGGLYVIGTNRHESRRIDWQLRGRAGRQGDPGESRFYISLEDDLLVKYGLGKMINTRYALTKQESPLANTAIREDIARTQRIIEGQNSDIRGTLRKYSYILDEQRKIIQKKRLEILSDDPGHVFEPQLLARRCPDLYEERIRRFGMELVIRVEKKITLAAINCCWSQYLAYIADIKESIHLVNLAAKSPIDEFHKMAISGFEDLKKQIADLIEQVFIDARIDENGIDADAEGLKGPSSTWTYLVDDKLEISILPILTNTAVVAVNPALTLLLGIYNRFFKKRSV